MFSVLHVYGLRLETKSEVRSPLVRDGILGQGDADPSLLVSLGCFSVSPPHDACQSMNYLSQLVGDGEVSSRPGKTVRVHG